MNCQIIVYSYSSSALSFSNTIVVQNMCVCSFLQVVLGERKIRPSLMNQELAQSILAAQNDTSYKTILGGTMCTDDFFEGI